MSEHLSRRARLSGGTPLRSRVVRWLVGLGALGMIACGDSLSHQGSAVGSACTAAGECGTGAPFECEQDLAGGYCTRACRLDADCPGESVCVGPISPRGGGSTGGARWCRAVCASDGDCRSGGGLACLPATSDPASYASAPHCDRAPAPPPDEGAFDAPGDGATS